MLAVDQAERVGCAGLATDAKTDGIPFYRKFGFVPIADPTEQGTQLHFLALRHFETAAKATRGTSTAS